MFRVDETTIYSREEAEQLLEESGVSLSAFFGHFHARTTYRNVVLGTELLAIMRRAGDLVHQHAVESVAVRTEPNPREPEPFSSRKTRTADGKTVHERWKAIVKTASAPKTYDRISSDEDETARKRSR